MTSIRKSTPLVSVIIPTHNRANMLKRSIKSVLNQSYRPLEIIVVSDGSTDDTEKVIKQFEKNKIIFIKHLYSKGSSATRNTGLKKAKGEYIAFLDDDDEWLPNKLKKQVNLLNISPPEVGLIYGWMAYYKKDKKFKIIAPTLRGNVFKQMLSRQALGGTPTLLFKKSILCKTGLFNEDIQRGDDGDFIRKISKYYHVDYIPEIVAKIHTGHSDRLSINNRINSKKAIKELKYRLSYFAKDFQKYHDEKEKVLLKIAGHYLLLLSLIKCLKYFKKANQTKVNKNYFKKIKTWISFFLAHLNNK